MGHQFYIQLSMEVLGGGGVAGSILTGLNCLRLSRNFVFYCNAARPFQTEFIFAFFFPLSICFMDCLLFILRQPEADGQGYRLFLFIQLQDGCCLVFFRIQMLLVFKLLIATCTYHVTIIICESKIKKSNQMNP